MLNRFILLLGWHFLADYPLQGDFLAKGKNKYKPSPFIPWYQALTAHSVIHGVGVLVITKSVKKALAEIVIHAITDNLKCKGVLTFNRDQLIHIICKAFWSTE